jgi:7,8-dihydropterin-6-yl-methyl-4-(beta-D-ribofuranosyl)aminobenzene 5'-phosphate synthase
MKITVVYDNDVLKEGLKSGWGFSCLIDKDILFDTGDNGAAVLYNMEKLGIDPNEIKSVVLSHGHWDHVDGLPELLKVNPSISIYSPPQFYRTLMGHVPEETKLIESRGPTRIRQDVTTTGVLGTSIEEQALACLDKKGVIVITGCSHPGLGELIDAASKFGEIYGVLGGFHGFSDLDALKDIKLISPCHCTQYKKEIIQTFPKQCVECGAGLVIE